MQQILDYSTLFWSNSGLNLVNNRLIFDNNIMTILIEKEKAKSIVYKKSKYYKGYLHFVNQYKNMLFQDFKNSQHFSVCYICLVKLFRQVFSFDWYMRPMMKIVCTESGTFTAPDDWPYCVERNLLFYEVI